MPTPQPNDVREFSRRVVEMAVQDPIWRASGVPVPTDPHAFYAESMKVDVRPRSEYIQISVTDANPATAADWLRHCRRAGLYDLGRALYEKGGFNFAELGDEGLLEVEEDYQICVRRSGG